MSVPGAALDMLQNLREYHEALAGMRMAESAGGLSRLEDALAENACIPSTAPGGIDTLSAADNLAGFLAKRDAQRSVLESERNLAIGQLDLSATAYREARTGRMVLEKLLERRDARAQCDKAGKGDDARDGSW